MGRLHCPRSIAGPHRTAFRQDCASQHHGNQDERKENGSKCSTRGVKKKGKAIPLQAWIGPEFSNRLRFPDFKTVGT